MQNETSLLQLTPFQTANGERWYAQTTIVEQPDGTLLPVPHVSFIEAQTVIEARLLGYWLLCTSSNYGQQRRSEWHTSLKKIASEAEPAFEYDLLEGYC